MYVPGLRFTDSVFEPPEKVGVAPTTLPEEVAIVKLCDSEDEFVYAIETAPALAVSEVVSNFNCPSALAARLSGEPLAAAGVEDAAELVADDADELVVFDELPQPASAITPDAIASAESLGRNCEFARAAVLNLTGLILRWLGPSAVRTPSA